jgi:hypothetical protein
MAREILMDRPETPEPKPVPMPSAELTVVLIGGLLVVGRLESGSKLVKPRVLRTYEEREVDNTGKEIMVPKISLTPFPGVPPFVILNGETLHYTVPKKVQNKAIYELYERVTNPAVDPG